MRIALIAGSHRPNGESARVAHYVANAFTRLFPQHEAEVLSLAGNPIPPFIDDYWDKGMDWHPTWKAWSQTLAAADGVIFVVPEWHGMVPSGVKNVLQLASNGELSHKAGLLVGVSSSTGGAYVVAEMRMNASKNTKICLIPEHLIVRDVTKMLHGEEPASDADRYIRERIAYALKVFEAYAQALGTVRASGVTQTTQFKNGM